jgi:hypothetical protein
MRGGESELSYLLLELACDTFVVNRCKLNMLQSTFNLCISVSFLLLGGLPAVACTVGKRAPFLFLLGGLPVVTGQVGKWASFLFTWRAI